MHYNEVLSNFEAGYAVQLALPQKMWEAKHRSLNCDISWNLSTRNLIILFRAEFFERNAIFRRVRLKASSKDGMNSTKWYLIPWFVSELLQDNKLELSRLGRVEGSMERPATATLDLCKALEKSLSLFWVGINYLMFAWISQSLVQRSVTWQTK